VCKQRVLGMSEIYMTMDIDSIFPMTLRRGCDADVRITLVWPHLPSDESTYTPTEIGVWDARI